jgi:hypothetical protein
LRLLFTLALLETCAVGVAVGNPIAIYSVPNSISLIAEEVDIATHENQSVVSGTYGFLLRKGDFPFVDDQIIIKVPIILHEPQSFGSLKSSTAASLAIGRRVFHPSNASVDSQLRDLPSGWKLYYLEFEIPLRALRPVFNVAIRYHQPHLPGSISPYYPIHPPDRSGSKSIVRYLAAEPASLTLVSKGDRVIEAQRTRIAVEPEHHKLILVRVNKT